MVTAVSRARHGADNVQGWHPVTDYSKSLEGTPKSRKVRRWAAAKNSEVTNLPPTSQWKFSTWRGEANLGTPGHSDNFFVCYFFPLEQLSIVFIPFTVQLI